jgi:LCP family protein required for cell wall assembly
MVEHAAGDDGSEKQQPAATTPGPSPAVESPPATSVPAPGTPVPDTTRWRDRRHTRSRAQARTRRRRSRRARIAIGICASLAIIIAVGAVTFYAAYRHLNGNIRQADISHLIGPQPLVSKQHSQAENIAIIGSDTRQGQGSGYGSSQELVTDQSDTLLIVHIAASRKWAEVMSIPRDSWVSIPSCLEGNGQHSAPQTFKINEAFALGNLDGNHTTLGVACTIKTVEHDTGIPIDHFIVVNFDGLKDMVRALGGVPECNTTPIDDPLSGLHLTAGHHVLDGNQALAYVRARYTLGNGSDLERIGRQQAFMSALASKARSKLLNPLAIYRFLDAATKALTVDTQLGGVGGLYDLGSSLKNMPAGQLSFFTLPNYPRSLVDPSDLANVMWTQPLDSRIFAAFRNDVPVSQALLAGSQAPKLPAREVHVTVLNGTGQFGLAASVAAVLEQHGYKITAARDLTSERAQTVIRYGPGHGRQASRLAETISGAAFQQVSSVTHGVTLVLGGNYGTTATVVTPPTSVSPSPQATAPTLHTRKGSQGICT